jgi:hypothetical protein
MRDQLQDKEQERPDLKRPVPIKDVIHTPRGGNAANAERSKVLLLQNDH